MIYASDLDQTLIYSQRALGSGVLESNITPAETKDGNILSYIAVQALSLLREVSDQSLFVPVTTRTIEQYRRIQIFQDLIKPKYAITSNGGNILINGVVDQKWSRHISRKVQNNCSPSHEIQRLIHEIATPEWVIGERFCDGLFFAFVIKREQMPLQEIVDLAEQLTALGWDTSIQGRKIYLVPQVVSKKNAVAYLQELEDINCILASGDSLLDRCMLDFADYAIAPRHGELYRQHLEKQTDAKYVFTKESGVLAAVEILQFALQVLDGWKTSSMKFMGRG